jgi:cysteine desulfurase
MACHLARNEWKSDGERIISLRQKLEQSFLTIPDAKLNGSLLHRLPNVSNICFKGVDGPAMMMAVSRFVALSSGSACTSVTQEPSFVLKAMGLSDEEARSSFRFSLGRFTTDAEIDFAIQKFNQVLPQFR